MSYKEWEKLINKFKESGKSQAQWCRDKNIKDKAFNYQYRKFRRIIQDKQVVNQINWMPVKLEPLMISKLSIRNEKAVTEIEKGYDEVLLQNVVKSREAICLA